MVKRLSATNANSGKYSKYVLRTKLTTKGKYRFRAYTRATSAWARGSSALSTTLTVK